MTIQFDQTLDVKGAKCPLPLVKSRKAIGELRVGQVLQVVATDRGSVADFQGWAKVSKLATLREQRTEKDETGRDVYVHVVERTT